MKYEDERINIVDEDDGAGTRNQVVMHRDR